MSFSHIKIHDYEMRYKALAERSTCFFYRMSQHHLYDHQHGSDTQDSYRMRHIVIYDDATRFNWKIDGISYIAPIFGIVKEQRVEDVWNTI